MLGVEGRMSLYIYTIMKYWLGFVLLLGFGVVEGNLAFMKEWVKCMNRKSK